MTTTANEYPTNREIVINAIGAYGWDYENKIIHRHFVTWCEVIALNHIYKDRDLIKNDSIYNYYRFQWKIRVENRFVNENINFLNQGITAPDIYYQLICSYAEELEDYYPETLLKRMPLNEKLDFTLN